MQLGQLGQLGDALEYLLAPIAAQSFFTRHWERRPLHIPRAKPTYYDDLFTLTDLDNLLTRQRHDISQGSSPRLSLLRDGYNIPPNEIARGKNKVIDVIKINRRIHDDTTLVIDDIDRMVPAVGELDARLSRLFSARVWTNLYYSPARSRGLESHYDSHDVFVLQVHGRKRWSLYNRPVGIPLPTQRFDESTMEVGALSRRLTLRRGDLLYIPKGLAHSAASMSEASLHLSIGIESVTWAELLVEACSELVARKEELRRALPPNFAGAHADRRSIERTLMRIVRTLPRDLNVSRALERLSESLADDSNRTFPGLIEQTLRRASLTPDSTVGIRPGLHYVLKSRRSVITLKCHGNEISLPARQGSALRHALSSERFTIRDLPGPLSDAEKVELVRELVSEGIIRVLAFTARNAARPSRRAE